jgi:hypothetical protein
MPLNTTKKHPPMVHEVIIAGGGPTGLMLAGEPALGGVDVGIIEQRLNQDIEGSRANGLHPRSIELLDQRGIADKLISQGKKHFIAPFAGVVLDASDRPSRHNYTLALWQEKIERTLGEWVARNRWPRAANWPPGCRQPGVEARVGRQGSFTRKPARHLRSGSPLPARC